MQSNVPNKSGVESRQGSPWTVLGSPLFTTGAPGLSHVLWESPRTVSVRWRGWGLAGAVGRISSGTQIGRFFCSISLDQHRVHLRSPLKLKLGGEAGRSRGH
jgi:hypothetical protein